MTVEGCVHQMALERRIHQMTVEGRESVESLHAHDTMIGRIILRDTMLYE